jgi:hypothetical protein
MKGTVQGYFDRAFDEMTDKELEEPLAYSGPGRESQAGPEPQEGKRSTPNV